MIKIIMGMKGTGKTKTLIEQVNSAVQEAHGNVVCIEKGTKLRYDVSHQARLISAAEYKIDDYEKFFGFISGIVAGNFDITHIFIDSITKICGGNTDMNELEKFVEDIQHISENIQVTLTVSYDEKEAPEAIKKYF